MRHLTRLIPIAVLFTAACDRLPTAAEPDAPPGLSLKSSNESDLTFLPHVAGAPALANFTASFWAVKGKTRQASLYYRRQPGELDSTEFVRFRVDDKALFKRPNGTPFAKGDSVLITLAVVDTARLIVDFQPSGLSFDPKSPARLWISWAETLRDLNGDGAVNGADEAIRLATQSIWKQETAGALWQTIKTSFDFPFERMSAKITSFTRYAMAY